MLDGGRGGRLDPVQHECIADLLDEIDHIVEAADERVDVLAIEGRNEGVLEPVPDVVADLVATVLRVTQLTGTPLDGVVILEHRLEQSRGAEDVRGVFDEQVEKPLLAGNQAHHGQVAPPLRTR